MTRIATQTVVLLVVMLVLVSCGGDRKGDSGPMVSPASLGEFLPKEPGINVLVISFDAMRQDALGAYGDQHGMTPNLDAFAADAAVFENAYTVGHSTPASFAAAFTGKLPLKTLRKWKVVNAETMAEVFQDGGYRTGGFFNNVHLNPMRNYDKGFEQYSVGGEQDDEGPLEEVMKFVGESSDKPFFAWVHFINPHSPYLYREMAEHFYTPGYTGEFDETSGGHVQGYDTAEMSEADKQRLRELYRGEVFFADYRFGQVIDHLKSLDLLDRTVVLVTADHGEAMLEHQQFGHSKLFEEVVRIPLLLRHPSGTRPVRFQERVTNMDFLPTLAGIAGLDFDDDLDGANLIDTFDSARPILGIGMTNPRYHALAIQHDGKKLFAWCGKREYWEELYDLAQDPGEQNNLIDEDAATVDELYEILEGLVGGHPCDVIEDALGGVGKFDEVDKEMLQQLRSLGYIQ